MPAGREIVDALECVLSVYFSNVRHQMRAAFLLCDELVEVTCRAKFKQTHPAGGRINFFHLLGHASVGLDPSVPGLGETLNRSHETRNQMQHAVAAATVDEQHCADAILDAVAAMEHCFPGTLAALSEAIRVGLRVVRIQSSQGSARLRADFEEEMRRVTWNSPLKRARNTTVPYPVGSRQYWGLVIMSNNVTMGDILDRIGAP